MNGQMADPLGADPPSTVPGEIRRSNVDIVDGGRVAAWGFLYQYLRTVEAVLETVEDDRFGACRVEGGADTGEVGSPDIVDFDLTGPDGEVLLTAQVKTGGSAASLGTGTAYHIMVKLITRCDAERYELLTNLRLAPGTRKIADLLARSGLSVGERRAELARILDEVKSKADVAELTDGQIERLGRCRLLVDVRDREDVADSVRTKVWDFRRKRASGIGPQSSGLLLAHLLFEVHRRAAFVEHAVWTKDEVLHAVVQNEAEIVAVLGSRDWGSVLGLMAPVPDLPRTALVKEIVSALQPYRAAGRSVRHCTLTGLSGIGKSSLASAYVATYADAYEAIYWIDATSPASIENDFRTLAVRFGGEQGGTNEQVRSIVHETLSRRAGRSLLVFDDATPQLMQQWSPRLADADVLITTTDSTARVGTAIEVTALTGDEAVELIHRRLDEPLIGFNDQAKRLATALEGWPLALELATRYMRAFDYTLADVDYYLEELKVQSLGDDRWKPSGYPRTLIAAIDLSLTFLHRSNSSETAGLAREMLMRASYLSGRRIPIHLLVVTLALDADGRPQFDNLSESHGPVVIQDQRPKEAVLALCQISFARYDERLSWRRSNLIPTADHTIAVNAVLQEVVRHRIENGAAQNEWKDELRRLAFHVGHWLSTATNNHEVTQAHQLAAHAAALVSHLRRLGVTNRHIAWLIGNLAGVYIAEGRDEAAIDLLRSQIDMILNDTAGVNPFLEHQARLHLARALINSDQVAQLDPHPTVVELSRVLTYAQKLALDGDTHKQAAYVCVAALSTLSILHDHVSETGNSRALATVFRELQQRLSGTPFTEAVQAIERIDRMISAGEDESAEREARALLVRIGDGSGLNAEIRRLLVEALAGQGKWGQCRAEMNELAAELGDQPLLRESAHQALYNIALKLTGFGLLLSSPEPRTLLQHLLGMPCFVHTRTIARGEYRAKFDFFSLAAAVYAGRIDDIREGLTKVTSAASRRYLEQDQAVNMLMAEIIPIAQTAL